MFDYFSAWRKSGLWVELNDRLRVKVRVADGRKPSPTEAILEFFASNRETFEIIFVDGLHHRDVVFRDLCNALRVLKPGGLVVCHDLYPSTDAMQRVPRETSAWTGD